MNRAIGIVRVSRTAGREGDKFHSPEIQREHIKRDCERFGLELTDVFEELDVSGGKPISKRPGLSKALALVEGGRAEAIVFAYRDRMDRDIIHGSELIRRMDSAGATLIAAGRQITHSTYDGWRHATFESFLNEDQRRAVSAKLRDVHVRNVESGVVPFPMPVGYRRRENGTAEVDPKTAPLIREAFERRAAGKSLASICAWLGEHDIKLSVAGLRKVFARRFYLGELWYRPDIVEPNLTSHEPIVSTELFDAVQTTRGAPRGRQPKTNGLLSRLDVLRCRGCEGRMSLSRYSRRAQPFYRCTTPRCPAGAAIMAHVIEPKVIEATLELCRGLMGSATRESGVLAAKAKLDQSEAVLQRVLRRLTAAGVEDEDVAVEELRALRGARDEARRAYDAALEADAGARLAITAEDVFERGTLDEQRELISAVVETVWVKQGRTKAERAERVEIVGRTL